MAQELQVVENVFIRARRISCNLGMLGLCRCFLDDLAAGFNPSRLLKGDLDHVLCFLNDVQFKTIGTVRVTAAARQ